MNKRHTKKYLKKFKGLYVVGKKKLSFQEYIKTTKGYEKSRELNGYA